MPERRVRPYYIYLHHIWSLLQLPHVIDALQDCESAVTPLLSSASSRVAGTGVRLPDNLAHGGPIDITADYAYLRLR